MTDHLNNAFDAFMFSLLDMRPQGPKSYTLQDMRAAFMAGASLNELHGGGTDPSVVLRSSTLTGKGR